MAYRFTFSVLGDDLIDRTLARFAENTGDARPLWNYLADRFARLEARAFRSQGSATGPAWAELSPRYKAWKLRAVGGKPILELYGDLVDSLTRRPFGVEVIEPAYMRLGTAVPYAIYHQQGTPNMPARPPVRFPEAERREWVNRIQRFIVTGEPR